MSRRSWAGDTRGSVTLELVVWAPALLAVIALLIVAGRINSAHGAIEQAAGDAARTASIARTATAAVTTARASAEQSLASRSLRCADLTVEVDTTGFTTPAGQPATVSATVSCAVQLAGLLPGLPGTRLMSHTTVSTLDTFRGRS